MPRKTAKTMKRRRHRGGGYGFGGSILDNVAGAGAGNVDWKPTSGECGVARGGNNDLAPLQPVAGGRRRSRRRVGGGDPADNNNSGRGGNQAVAGGRRRRRNSKRGGKRRHSRRRTMKGGSQQLSPAEFPGGNTLALQQSRTSYTFDGSGYGGMANAVPVPPYTTYV